jgi:hypothetical protein
MMDWIQFVAGTEYETTAAETGGDTTYDDSSVNVGPRTVESDFRQTSRRTTLPNRFGTRK